ncbi:MAG: response regulator [Cyanobacteriota bacterium]
MLNMSNYTILLVEDDSNDIFLIQRAFRKANLLNPLQVVENGEAAVFYLEGNPPYSDRDRYPLPVLILLDLRLPRKSGLEVLEWLRQQPDLKRLPVVVLSSSKENREINRAYDLGANSYLVKPVAFEALLDMVKTLNSYWLIFNQKPKLEES